MSIPESLQYVQGNRYTTLIEKYGPDFREALQRADSGLLQITAPGLLDSAANWMVTVGQIPGVTIQNQKYQTKESVTLPFEARAFNSLVFFQSVRTDKLEERQLMQRMETLAGPAMLKAFMRQRDDYIYSLIEASVQVRSETADPGRGTLNTRATVTRTPDFASRLLIPHNFTVFDSTLVSTGAFASGATTSLTPGKLKAALTKLKKLYNMNTEGQCYLIAPAEQIAYMESLVTSVNTQYIYNLGSLKVTPLCYDLEAANPKDSSSTYDKCFLVAKGAIQFTEVMSPTVKLRELDEYITEPNAIEVTAEYGGVRAYEDGIIQINCATLAGF